MCPAYKVWQRFARANLAFRVSLSKFLITVNNSGGIASADICSSAILRPIFQGFFRDQRCRADYSDRIMIGKLSSAKILCFSLHFTVFAASFARNVRTVTLGLKEKCITQQYRKILIQENHMWIIFR